MICFCWLGFPQYGARGVRAFVHSTDETVVVVATRPTVPIEGMDEIAGCRVIWIDIDDGRSITEIVGEIPRIITVPSWSFRTFDRFRKEVRDAGGRAIMASDNNLEYNRRIIAKMIMMRLGWRFKYDGFWVPHKSGRRLMRFFGVPDSLIFEGMYTADAGLFTRGEPIKKRSKKLLFVGSLNDNKNPVRLAKAFLAVDPVVRAGWMLEIYGCGPRKEDIPHDPSIAIMGFIQPEQLASKYIQARAFCLPSGFDHFGLVVHEATLSGCALLLSNRVGAADDLLDEGVNGYSFSPHSENEMTSAITRMMQWPDEQLDRAYNRSLDLSAKINFEKFVAGVKAFSRA